MARVLVVDDDLDARETFSWFLRESGHEVTTAKSGREALRLADRDPPDVMFIDLRLPDITAVEVVRALRASGTTLPIIVMTGFGTIPSAVEAIKLGAVDYLEKPLDVDEVVDAVERALQGVTGHPLSVLRADGVALWAAAVASVLGSPHDPKTVAAWAAVRGVATETLRSWCRTNGLSPKRSLDLARVLRAAYRGRAGRIPAERFLHVADHRTLERLLAGAGLRKDAPPPTLDDLLGRQKFITEAVALRELGLVLREFAIDPEAQPRFRVR